MATALDLFVHPTADVSPQAHIGTGTRIWHHAHIREGARIGAECVIAKNVYVDFDVVIGSRVKIQNNVSVYHGVTIEDGVFIGPHVCFTNDTWPRAINFDGSLKGPDAWTPGRILVRAGASVGAGSVILPEITIGKFAMVGAGSVVTRPVPDHVLVYGHPARHRGYVCRCGRRLEQVADGQDGVTWNCVPCNQTYLFARESLDRGERS